MSELIGLHVSILLKHILDRGPKSSLSGEASDWDSEGSDDKEEEVGESRRKLVAGKTTRGHQRRQLSPHQNQLLDFEGPKLINGIKNWLLFYQIIGQMNFIGQPLYVSIIYKVFILGATLYIMTTRLIIRFLEYHVVDNSFKNPIFMFISFLATISLLAQILVTMYVNLFDLCPLYKILTTPKLCFINIETQHTIGSKSLAVFLIFSLYNTILMSMGSHRSWTEFVNDFYLPTFLVELYAINVYTYYLVGLIQLDLYIRCSFGCWLLALKAHLERQFTYLHRYQRRSMRLGLSGGASNSSSGELSPDLAPRPATGGQQQKSPPLQFITLDEIQKNLNHMDDHLEVLRGIQNSTLVLITLNAFVGNGALFLLAYHLMADQSNYFHGLIFLVLSINFIVVVFLSYAGDRWVSYALSSFVQTVEDEYFMQSDIKALDVKSAAAALEPEVERLEEPAHEFTANHMVQQTLLIKKKDVLFCREFLHQFENHLATPWSKLTFKSHLHLLRTFVTLIAAQIIFDHEH